MTFEAILKLSKDGFDGMRANENLLGTNQNCFYHGASAALLSIVVEQCFFGASAASSSLQILAEMRAHGIVGSNDASNDPGWIVRRNVCPIPHAQARLAVWNVCFSGCCTHYQWYSHGSKPSYYCGASRSEHCRSIGPFYSTGPHWYVSHDSIEQQRTDSCTHECISHCQCCTTSSGTTSSGITSTAGCSVGTHCPVSSCSIAVFDVCCSSSETTSATRP
jgi:hypothetical protein